MPWKAEDGGHTKKGAKSGDGGFVIDTKQYEKLRAQGMPKAMASAIANSRNKAAKKRAAEKADTEGMTTEAAAAPGTSSEGSVFAAVGANAPQWRKIIRIDFTEKGPVSTVVQDYKLTTELSELIEAAILQHMDELADDDDTPEQQRLLMSAWQALAMYLATCDDEDKNQAATALKVVSDLMSGTGDGTGPFPADTFGKTVQTAAAAPGPNKTVYECAVDKRTFSTQQGLINHLQVAHNMNPVKARATAMKAGS